MGVQGAKESGGKQEEKQRDYHRVEVGVSGERTPGPGKQKKAEKRSQRPAVGNAASETEEGRGGGAVVGNSRTEME